MSIFEIKKTYGVAQKGMEVQEEAAKFQGTAVLVNRNLKMGIQRSKKYALQF